MAQLKKTLSNKFEELERKYDITVSDWDAGDRLSRLIRLVSEKEKAPVVVLIYEYDRPLIGHLANPGLFFPRRGI